MKFKYLKKNTWPKNISKLQFTSIAKNGTLFTASYYFNLRVPTYISLITSKIDNIIEINNYIYNYYKGKGPWMFLYILLGSSIQIKLKKT